MAESLEKQLISSFAAAWNESTPAVFGSDSTLSLLALREVSGDGMAGALAVASTWSSAFVAPCNEALAGLIIVLLKSDDCDQIDKLTRQPIDGSPKPGGRAVVGAALKGTIAKLAAAAEPVPVNFDEVVYLDLSADEARLPKIAGDAAWFGTFSLTVGDEIETQALLLYTPHGSLGTVSTPAVTTSAVETIAPAPTPTTPTPPNPPPAQNSQPAPTATRRGAAAVRQVEVPRNIERLLDVELDVVVRFGVTNMSLRDVVRMGTGTMVELDRSVDEPVELLVNGRPFARGEVVVIDGYYGVRITEIGSPTERALSLT